MHVLRFYSIFLGESPPPAPRDCFGREELIEKVVGLAQNLEPIALIGAGGIGKTSIVLTVLHHSQIKKRFGENRRFIRCDQFPASSAHFLALLSKVIGARVENPQDLTSLRNFLSSKEMFIILDNAESVLDPKQPGSKEIYSIVDELCQFPTICLCITSRIRTVPPRCKLPEIPTLSMEAACDIFYNTHRDVERSSVINDLLERLDFHALSIKLLATTASHNSWDHDRLANEWDAHRAQVLRTQHNESLAATIELSLSSPTFRSLGSDARNLLGVVAFFPQGVNENHLNWIFPTISDWENVFDKLCVLSLTHQSNGFITMLAPIRDYLTPKHPRSSPLLCKTRDCYFSRLSVYVHPASPGFEEARWIALEDVNVEYLLDVFTSIDQTGDDVWEACFHFMAHLHWHKPRKTILESKIRALSDDHRSKPKCLSRLSGLFERVGDHTGGKALLVRTLELERRRGNEAGVADTLRLLSHTNRFLGLRKEGIRQAKEALQIFERINVPAGKAVALNTLARLLFDDKQLDAAKDTASHAIDLVLEKGQDDEILCRLYWILGEIHQSKGEKEKAIHYFKTSIETASPFNWHNQLFWAHYSLADLFRCADEFDDANANIGRAKSHAAHDGYKLARAMRMQARVWLRQCRFEDAKSEALHALEIYEKFGAVKDVEVCQLLLRRVERASKI